MTRDLEAFREVARHYAEAAADPSNAETVKSYRDLNALKPVRPPVLVFEEPWGEFSDCEELTPVTEDPFLRSFEIGMRRELYKWNHHRGSYALRPYFCSPLAIRGDDIGMTYQDVTIESLTGSDIKSHAYKDLLPDRAALAKLHLPDLYEDKAESDRTFERLSEAFDGLMPVKKVGTVICFSSWDRLAEFRGVQNCLFDMMDDPEFIHEAMELFTQINLRRMDRYEELNLLDTDPYYLHCTPACTYELPVLDHDTQKATLKGVWCRVMAQALAVVSPQMLEDFDLVYTKRLFDRCGLSYYGCCEPLSGRIDRLKRLFPNLRRVSITPWADKKKAAEEIDGTLVYSCKTNPALVGGQFDPAPIEAEVREVLNALKDDPAPCEFILKDVSTVGKDPENLRRWVETVNRVIDEVM